jgi:hypothetical protein
MKRTRLPKGTSKPCKGRLKKYSKAELEKVSVNLQKSATEFANGLVRDIKNKEYPAGVAQLTYGYVPPYRALSEIEKLYQDMCLKPEDFDWLYNDYAGAIADIVFKRTGWYIVCDPADGTVLLAASPKWAKKNMDW